MAAVSVPPGEAFDYQKYLASREWGKRKAAVRARSKGWCERCGQEGEPAKAVAVHHLTYANIGNEPPEDLQHVCGPCHEFLSGTSDEDPSAVEELAEDTYISDVASAVSGDVQLYEVDDCLYIGECPNCQCPRPLIVQDLFGFWACSACEISGGSVASWIAFCHQGAK